MGTIQKLFNNAKKFFGMDNKSSKHHKVYNADELRKERGRRADIAHKGLNKQGRRTHKTLFNYLSYRAKKNSNCMYAKTKGFTIRNKKRKNFFLAMLRDLLDRHDWYYEYSDDHNAYLAGSVNRDKIMEMKEYVSKEDFVKTWNEFAPKNFKL